MRERRWKEWLLAVVILLPPLCAFAATPKGADSPVFVTWREPKEGAFTLGVPQGWQVTGGVRRLTPVDVRWALNVISPDGKIRVFIGDFDVAPAREPDQITRTMGLREGYIYNGVLLARHLNAVEFSRRYAAWKLCRQPQILQSGLLAKETETANAQVARYAWSMGMAGSVTVGEAMFRCGQAVGFVMAAVVYTRPARGPGVSGWAVYQLAGFTSQDPAQGYFAKYVLSTMLGSMRMNPEWERRSAQAAGQYANTVMQMSNAVAQTVIQHARQQSAQGSAGGWNHPNKGDVPKINRDPNVERRSDEARRGTRHVCDDLGTCATVDNSWSHVWRDHNGNVVPGTASGYPPDYSGQWTEMK
jgi:hypothetical protein